MDTPMSGGSPLPFQSVSTDLEGHAEEQHLDENDERNHAVYFSQNNIIIPLLRKYIHPFVENLYNNLVRCEQINTQQPPNIKEHHHGFLLNYASINDNQKRNRTDWNYMVTEPVDFSKLFLKEWESKYTDFTECQVSAVLGIIQHMDVFPEPVRTHIINYRKQVRNPVSHEDKTKWNNNNFKETLEMMKSLIRSLEFPENEIQQSIAKLDEWIQGRVTMAIVRRLPVHLKFKQDETTGSDHIEANVHGLNKLQEKKTAAKLTQTEPQECELLPILRVSKGSIKLDLRADPAIFKTPEIFKAAVHELLERVIDASGIIPDEFICLDVDFVLPKSLNQEQLKVVDSAFPGSFPDKDTPNELPSTSETGDVSNSWTESEVYFMRCISVLMEIFPKILRIFIEESMIPATAMYAKIQSDDIFKQKLTANDNKALQTLLEDGYTKLDVSLILKIIIYYANIFISSPTKGWSSIPTSTETNDGDDVQRLRLMRNSFLYKDSFKVSEEEFTQFFSEVSSICERIDKMLTCTDGESFKEMVESKRKQPLKDLMRLKDVYNDERSKAQLEVVSTGFPGLLPGTDARNESNEMIETSDTINSWTESHLRLIRCSVVVLQVFPKILQRIMEISMISAKALYARIQRDSYFKKKLANCEHTTLHTLQTDGYKKLDQTLIFKIITHYANMFISPPTRGWSSNPATSETEIGDDLQRLRLMRNHFLHKVTAEASQEEFEEFFDKATLVCKRIDRYFNCSEAESFEVMVERCRIQVFFDSETTHRMNEEMTPLTAFYIGQVEGDHFQVLKVKSLKTFITEMKENQVRQQETTLPITLTFPDISVTEFEEVMNNIREEINKGVVDIRIVSMREG